MTRNIAASVHQRLLNLARAEKRDFNRLLLLYTQERFLARLSASRYQSEFVLKGGLFLYSQYGQAARPTRDLDLLGRLLPSDIAKMIDVFQEVAEVQLEDGIRFDTTSVMGSRIREEAEFEGVRIQIMGYLGSASVPVQIDIGFGDNVVPPPQTIDYPTLLDNEASPTLLAYNLETVIAEKFQAMTVLGTSNSRMKDFYDILFISGVETFEAEVLAEAITVTFAVRGTELAETTVFGEAFATHPEMKVRWTQFQTKNPLPHMPAEFAEVMTDIKVFLEPVIKGQAKGNWQAQQRSWSG